MVLFRAGAGRAAAGIPGLSLAGARRWRRNGARCCAERGRLAREIHDTLAQGFVGISVQLELVARLLAGSREAAPPDRLQQLDQARALVRASLADARTSIWDLRSESRGRGRPALPPAAELHPDCRRLSGQGVPSGEGDLPPGGRARSEEELLRIGQEAVANAVRHAAATRIDVQLIYEAARVSLRVDDDGRGFEPSPDRNGPEGHYGIQGMQERAGEIDAALVLESTPGGGTRVSVEAPLV